MIGLIASLLLGVLTGNYWYLWVALPYAIRIWRRKWAFVGVALYALALGVEGPSLSLYTLSGAVVGLGTFVSVFLTVEECLSVRPLRPTPLEIGLMLLLSIAALNDYAFATALTIALAYRAYERFGKTALYLLGWGAGTVLVLYMVRKAMPGPVAQTMALVGLSLVPFLLSERRDVEHAEVRVFE